MARKSSAGIQRFEKDPSVQVTAAPKVRLGLIGGFTKGDMSLAYDYNGEPIGYISDVIEIANETAQLYKLGYPSQESYAGDALGLYNFEETGANVIRIAALNALRPHVLIQERYGSWKSWQTGQTYIKGDKVLANGIAYDCLADNMASSPDELLNTTLWAINYRSSLGINVEQWKKSTMYKVGDRVFFDGILYKAIIDHTSGAKFTDNLNQHWGMVAEHVIFYGKSMGTWGNKKLAITIDGLPEDWKKSKNYMKNDKVFYNDIENSTVRMMKCMVNHKSLDRTDLADPNKWQETIISDFTFNVSISHGTIVEQNNAKLKVNNEVVETFNNVSPHSSDANYYVKRINSYSSWVEVDDLNLNPRDILTMFTNGTFVADCGHDGIMMEDEDGYMVSALSEELTIAALNKFQNPEEVAINLLYVPAESRYNVLQKMKKVCNDRGDCTYMIDPPAGYNKYAVVDWSNGILPAPTEDIYDDDGNKITREAIDDSFAHIYFPWLWRLDPYTNMTHLIPPGAAMVGVFAANERASGVTSEPAGTVNGVLHESIIGLQFKNNKDDRDLLYTGTNVINPIIQYSKSDQTDPNRGQVVALGSATATRSESILNTIKVRRTTNYIEREISIRSRKYLFSDNVKITWRAWTQEMSKFLSGIGGCLEGYTALMDETTVSQQNILDKESPAFVELRYADTIEVIKIYFNVNRALSTVTSSTNS